MITEGSTTDSDAAKGARRSLFKKPAWARPSGNDGENLFHRSNRTFFNPQGKSVAQRKSPDALKSKADTHILRVRSESPTENCPPGNRLNSDAGIDDCSTGTYTLASSADQCSPQQSQKSLHEQTKSNADTSNGDAHINPASLPNEKRRNSKNSDAHLAVLTEELEEAKPESAFPNLTSERSEEPEEEFPELARQARATARAKRAEEDTCHFLQDDERHFGSHDLAGISVAQVSSRADSEIDPVVQILITSNIENTKPLIVTRRYSQRLKDVRSAWIAHQSESLDSLEQIFLTWRGKRVFDVASCRSLRIPIEGHDDSLSKKDPRVHMEAMTPQIFDVLRKSREAAEHVGTLEEGFATSTKRATPSKETELKIILRSKALSDMKLIVKPTTTISKITHAFRCSNNIDASQDVYLVFDGERLSMKRRIEETEIADMNDIDVYIKK